MDKNAEKSENGRLKLNVRNFDFVKQTAGFQSVMKKSDISNSLLSSHCDNDPGRFEKLLKKLHSNKFRKDKAKHIKSIAQVSC